MKIISTNISLAKPASYNGKEIKTGIFKQATTDEVTIETMNIIGDEQADLINHGGEHKAVYAFSSNHYGYWKEALQNQTLSSGAFGENFTVSDLSEESINIGDHFRIGTALLEVSQPRIPCFKLGIALGNNKAPRLFTDHYCTGVYFRVITPGKAKTGDGVLIEKKASHDVTVKKLFQAYFDKDYEYSGNVLSKALSLDELAPEWKEKLQKRLAKTN